MVAFRSAKVRGRRLSRGTPSVNPWQAQRPSTEWKADHGRLAPIINNGFCPTQVIRMLGELFDPKAELLVYERCRPHWSQAGAIVFVTFRTHDSIPKETLEVWEKQKAEWMRGLGVSPRIHWSIALPSLSESDQRAFNRQFDRCREDFLDTCHGKCLLRRPELARIVADSLMHFDGERYRMGDFVIMPNHVHFLAAFATADGLKRQCASWLRYTARQINLMTGESGKFWQQEPFDHLVRNPEQYVYLRKYIRENPDKAKLRPEEYFYRRYEG